ncbi:MAG: helix-turn-helix domain-containing protein [Acidimicrobiales bacterium]
MTDHNLVPQEWIDGAEGEWVPDVSLCDDDPEVVAAADEAYRRLEAEHEIVASLAELRRAAGLNQTEVAKRWGHGQPHVSKVERELATIELSTLAGYVQALGGRLTLTVEAGNHVYHEDLVVGS